LSKQDDTLSFGIIVQETERGVISPEGKVTGLDTIVYTDLPNEEKVAGDMNDPVSFGKNPKEWRPTKKPDLEKLGFN